MKIRCVKKKIEKILQQAENFIGKNLDLEVLSCVILEVSDGYLKINSTNIDTSYSAEMPVVAESEGKVAIMGDILYKTISAIKDEEISMELVDNNLKISSLTSKIELNILSHDDFPNILKMESQNQDDLNKKINISVDDFLDGLNSTFYAASKSNIKPELSSIFISGDEKDIFFAATDGFRLAEKRIKSVSEDKEEFSLLLPNDSIPAVMKTISLEDSGSNIEIFIYKSQIFIKTKTAIIFSRLVDGDYVDYKKLIPEDVSTSVIVLKQDFLDSLKLVNIFSDDFHQIKMSVEKKELILDTNNNYGKNEIKVPAAIVGDDLEMKFNYKYIQDSFLSLKTDSFEFVFNEGKPLLIKPIGDTSFRYIVMPLSR
jgi:DNA polymerase-3 subunit beta